MTDNGYVKVLCRGCGRPCVVAESPHHKVFCALWCALEEPAFDNEERDSMLEMLDALDWTRTRLAKHFGMTRQRVYQVLDSRKATAA